MADAQPEDGQGYPGQSGDRLEKSSWGGEKIAGRLVYPDQDSQGKGQQKTHDKTEAEAIHAGPDVAENFPAGGHLGQFIGNPERGREEVLRIKLGPRHQAPRDQNESKGK